MQGRYWCFVIKGHQDDSYIGARVSGCAPDVASLSGWNRCVHLVRSSMCTSAVAPGCVSNATNSQELWVSGAPRVSWVEHDTWPWREEWSGGAGGGRGRWLVALLPVPWARQDEGFAFRYSCSFRYEEKLPARTLRGSDTNLSQLFDFDWETFFAVVARNCEYAHLCAST